MRKEFKSPLLTRATTLPDLEGELEAMRTAFNWDEARESGVVTPERGLDPKYDGALDVVQDFHDKLAIQLKEAQTRMGTQINIEPKFTYLY